MLLACYDFDVQKVFPDSQIVDTDDNPIGGMQLPEAIRQDKILRAARVYIFNPQRELLLQERGPKVFSPGLWCESASGHVDVGESYEQTALRELEEEMGVYNVDLEEVMYEYIVEEGYNWRAKRFNKLYVVDSYDGPITIKDYDEVAGYRWADLDTLHAEIQDHPARFTYGFAMVFEKYYQQCQK